MFNDLGNLENLSENERRTIEQLRALFGMANDEQAKDIKFNVVKNAPQVIPMGRVVQNEMFASMMKT